MVALIDLKNLEYHTPNQECLLKGIDFQLFPGECVLICGKSGSGKTTLLNVLSGLVPELFEGQLAGQGQMLGQQFPISDFPSHAEKIGRVFQNPKSQFFTSEVLSELAFKMENLGLSREMMQEKIQQVATFFEIEAFLAQPLYQLSGGQKQTVAFASSLLPACQILFLDEVASNLDKTGLAKLKQTLKHLKRSGVALVLVEHRLDYCLDLIDRIYVLENGQLKQELSAVELKTYSANELAGFGLRHWQAAVNQLTLQMEKKEATIQLQLENLFFAYPKQKEKQIAIPSLTLDNRQIIGLVGENGAGKSTLVQLLTGLLQAKQGRITLNGQLRRAKDLLAQSFLVRQEVSLQLFFESVAKELNFQAKRLACYDEIVAAFGLEQLLSRHPQSLSGGEKQRVAIASALLSGKTCLYFDEPTSGLDALQMQQVSQQLRFIQQNYPVLIVVISHDQPFLSQTCDRILKLEKGRITSA